MKAFDKLKQGVAAVREGGAEVIAAARKGHGGPASDGPQDPTDYLRHMTMNSNSNNSEYSRSSGQRSGLGQRSGPQRSGMQKNAGAGTVSWFGVPLSTQPCDLDRGRRVPKLLGALRRALEEGCGMEQEGVFRQSADGRLLTFIRQRLEAGEDPEAVLEGCSTEALSTLLKAWFSELPGGVWISGEEDAPKAKKGGKKGPATDGGRELESQLISAAHAGMPTAMLLKQGVRPQQREALLWLLDVLCEAATHSASSKMSIDNLAVVFAPVLVPTDEKAPPLEQLQRAKDGVTLVKALLKSHHKASSGVGETGADLTGATDVGAKAAVAGVAG